MATSTPEYARRMLVDMDTHLKARNPQIMLWENYYEGVHRLQFATSRFRATFGNLFREFADNWCELIVSASVERMLINGFRTGQGSTEADNDAATIWTDNCLDADYKMAHTEAVKLGIAYGLIDQENTVPDSKSPLITIEHPAQAIVKAVPGNHRMRMAGLKEWIDDYGRVCATVYLPDAIYRFEAEEKKADPQQPPPGLMWGGNVYPTDYINSPSAEVGTSIQWVPRKGVPFAVENRLAVVPLVPIRNNPTLSMGGRSDISIVIPIQDAVNKLVADMMIASEFASFAQRWATGLEIPKDPQTGKPLNVQQFLASVGRIWASEHPDTKFGQFQATDLRNYVQAIELLIQHVAAVTRTPPHYLLGQSGTFPSGDSLTSTETGLVAKVHSKQTDVNPSWGEIVKLAFRAMGDEKRAKELIRPIWGDAEQRIRAQRIDGAVKMTTLGVPQDAVFEEIQASPEQIERWHTMKKDMGLNEHSTQFAVMEEWEKAAIKGPPQQGPEGNLGQQQAATQATRVARI